MLLKKIRIGDTFLLGGAARPIGQNKERRDPATDSETGRADSKEGSEKGVDRKMTENVFQARGTEETERGYMSR